jgi:hypothetical protein
MTGGISTDDDHIDFAPTLQKSLSILGGTNPADLLSLEVEPSLPTTKVATTLTSLSITYLP